LRGGCNCSRDHASPEEFRFSRASSWTFFINICSGLQQISHSSRLSSGMSCLPSAAPLMLTRARPKLLSASRRQQSQTNVVLVPVTRLERDRRGRQAKTVVLPDSAMGQAVRPASLAVMSIAGRGQYPGPRTLLSALARQFDRNVPRGAHDPRASVRVGAAYDRFQNKNELFRKHVGRLVDGRFFGSVSAGGFEFNHLSESGPPCRMVAVRLRRQREAERQRNRLDRSHRRRILRR
jgi:hypothetical protein